MQGETPRGHDWDRGSGYTQRLIDSVSTHRDVIKDRSQLCPRDKEQLWHQVAAEVYSDWETTSKYERNERLRTLARKWRSLRDAYRRENRLRRQMRRAGNKHSRRVYFYYDQLRPILGADEAPDDDQDRDESSSESPLLKPVAGASSARKRKRQSRQSASEEFAEPDEWDGAGGSEPEIDFDPSEHRETEEPQPHEGGTQYDSEQLFLLSFAGDLSRLPARHRLWARAQISRVVQAAHAHAALETHTDDRKPLPDLGWHLAE